jgi:hypothetical protein
MTQSQTGPSSGGLLPEGSTTDLEVYTCTLRLNEGETPTVVVTCDTLKQMMVIHARVLDDIFAQHGIKYGSQRAFQEMARAFQLQCEGAEHDNLWPLEWNKLLDRRLVAIITLVIQPKKEENHVTGQPQ